MLKGSAEEADFAADQAQVPRGSAPKEYVEPQQALVINALTGCRFFKDQGGELAKALDEYSGCEIAAARAFTKSLND